MLEYILNNPNLKKYLAEYEEGQTLFLESDDSQDLYILLSGTLDVLKGRRKITVIDEKGSVFGEMSFLLGEKRSATIKAVSSVKTIRIPKEEVPSFLNEFPEVVKVLARFLAQRLKETSQIVFGMKEICDQLPDAVMITDKEGKILSWNRNAERLYGREGDAMYLQPSEDIYENPSQYREFIQDVVSKLSVTEKVLGVKHPTEGLRQISTSTTVMYDAQQNFQGILSLGRDVTKILSMEKKYRRIKKWFIPLLIALGILFSGLFWGYPHLSKGFKAMDAQKVGFRDRVAVDYHILKSSLISPLETGDRKGALEILTGCVDMQKGIQAPYKEIILLDKEKKVFEAVSMNSAVPVEESLGASYTGISFDKNGDSPYAVLTLYRAKQGHPMGQKDTEMAFELRNDGGKLLGWLLFKIDMNKLKEQYNVEESDLKKFQFER
jgi:PAS domain S-box-containing protein